MKYRVQCERVLDGVRNPFLAFRTAESLEGVMTKVLVRTWEFEATDEAEVRILFTQAKKMGEPQLFGMKIRSIEEIENEK